MFRTFLRDKPLKTSIQKTKIVKRNLKGLNFTQYTEQTESTENQINSTHLNKSINSIRTFYRLFQSKSGDRINEISKNTKDLLVNNRRFNYYIKEYTKVTERYTFKSPEYSNYPLLRISSSQIIPLSRNIKTFINQEKLAKLERNKKFQLKLEKPERIFKLKPLNEFRVKTYTFTNDNIKTLINEFISEWKYNNLVYDENKIFHQKSKEKYNLFINQKFDYIKNNRIENQTILLEKNYNTNVSQSKNRSFSLQTKYEINLKLSAMKLIFTNLSNNKITAIDIPFAYLFLYYYHDIDFFKFVLMSAVTFSENFEEITFDEEKISQMIKNSSEFIESFRDKKPNIEECTNEKKIIKSEKQATENKKLYNLYKSLWFTPKDVYKIELSLPEITLTIAQGKYIVKKMINKDLLLYLYVNNFQIWDFYVINFLFSLKIFRYHIENILSKRPRVNIEPKEKWITFNDQKVCNFINENKTFFTCFYTSFKRNNSIKIIYSLSILVNYGKLNPDVQFQFDFTFKQMRTIIEITKYEKIEYFFSKILITNFNEKAIHLNFDIFENFDFSIFNYEKKFFEEEERNESQKVPIHYQEEDGSRLRIKLIIPSTEKYEFSNFSSISHEYHKKKIQDQALQLFTEQKIEDWGKLFVDGNPSTTVKRGSVAFETGNKFFTGFNTNFNKKLWKRAGTLGRKSPKKMTQGSQRMSMNNIH